MQRRKPLTIKSVQEQLGPWLDKNSATSARQAEMAPLRRDMVTLLSFVRDNKVIGTQSTGNMPLKAIREVTAHFVNPPKLDAVIGGRTFSLRSEEDLWPLHLLHCRRPAQGGPGAALATDCPGEAISGCSADGASAIPFGRVVAQG